MLRRAAAAAALRCAFQCRLAYRTALARAQALAPIEPGDVPLGALIAGHRKRERRAWKRDQLTLRARARALRMRGRLRVIAGRFVPGRVRRYQFTEAGIQDLARACTLSFSVHAGDN